MPTLRSHRLETLFGGPINETLTFGQIMGLIPNAGEGPDLDFKEQTYVTSGNGGQKGTKSLCGDIAAMANANGGVIVLGMEEDDQARAKGRRPVDTSDDERRRLRQTVYGNVFPTPLFDIIPVEDPANPGHGFLVIWVARSAESPHAFSPQGTGRHYPRRVGTETVWLSEAEIAEAYRARFIGLADRLDQTDKIEAEFLKRLGAGQIFVVVTLVPDLPGLFTIDNEALKAFTTAYQGKSASGMGVPMHGFWSTLVGYRRLVASGSTQAHLPYSSVACELHQDGSGVFASAIESLHGDPQRREKLVDNNRLVLGIAAGLRMLGVHARDRAAAGGLAKLRATICQTVVTAPIMLVSNVGMPNEQVGPAVLHEPPSTEAVADLDDLATDGPGQVAVTHRLASGLHQAFGQPEAPLVTAGGGVRIRYWYRDIQQDLTTWAAAAGVEVSNEVIH